METVAGPQAVAPRPDPSAWAPLKSPMFRLFWVASLLSNTGTWIHEVGAGWLMTSLDASPAMVAAVRTSMSLPIVVLAIPAGVLADRIDKRRLLIWTQTLLLVVTAALAASTLAGVITPWGLLALTFVMGLGMVVHVPTWQAAIPEFVPSRQIGRAVALGSISFNLARTVGPAVGGVLIAVVGVWSAFAINAATFAVVIGVLLWWRRMAFENTHGRTFWASTRQGVRFAVRNVAIRNVMIGVVLFVMPGSALWSLLPLFARTQLGWGPQGFGVLVTSVGLGAVAGASVLHLVRRRLGSDQTIAAAMTLFAAGLSVMAAAAVWLPPAAAAAVMIAACLAMGTGWMATLTTLNATVQVTTPPRLRARGMGIYLTMMAASMSAGSFVWGQVAESRGLIETLWLAAAGMVFTAAISLTFSLSPRLDD